jgi:transposase
LICKGAVAFLTRELLVKQRTEADNGLRSQIYEFGYIAPVGIGYVPRLAQVVKDPEAKIPDLARDICRMLLGQIAQLTERVRALKAKIAAMSNEAEMPRRLQTTPGLGPITALAIETFVPPMEYFRRGRDFAAWLGLVPRQHSSGGKQKLEKTSKMGQRGIRRLLVIGATAMIRWASRRGAPAGSWLAADAGAQADLDRGCSAGEQHSHRCKHVLPGSGWRGASGRCCRRTKTIKAQC